MGDRRTVLLSFDFEDRHQLVRRQLGAPGWDFAESWEVEHRRDLAYELERAALLALDSSATGPRPLDAPAPSLVLRACHELERLDTEIVMPVRLVREDSSKHLLRLFAVGKISMVCPISALTTAQTT
jgi:hypothetical protein